MGVDLYIEAVKDIKYLKMIVIEIDVPLTLHVVVLFSRQGEERVFMFPGTPCLVPIYVQNRELVNPEEKEWRPC